MDPAGAADVPKVSVIVPAYNEAGAIEECVEQLQAMLADADFTSEIIVVDDGSTDGTGEILDSIEGIRVVRNQDNLGYGAALKAGMRRAVGEITVIADADGTYPIERVPDLVAAMEDHDMVVGARTGEHVKVPFIRRPAKWFITALASYLSDRRIPDLNSGLRAFRTRDAMRLFGILPDGFSFTTTITLAMLNSGMRVKFVPIDYYKRTGKSKIRPLRDTWNFIVLIVRTSALFNPLKFFLPPALVLFLAGFVKAAYDAIVFHDVYDSQLLLITSGLVLGAIGILADIVTRTRLILRD